MPSSSDSATAPCRLCSSTTGRLPLPLSSSSFSASLPLLTYFFGPHFISPLCSLSHSEIILSSEARMVTFLNKEGVRSLHRLDTIFTSGTLPPLLFSLLPSPVSAPVLMSAPLSFLGRNDVAKRLKYTKDIMARLITMQSSSATGSGPGTGHDRS
jgi:hypothetical protein